MADKIYKKELEQTLRKIPSISPAEREKLMGTLGKTAESGLSKLELKQHLDRMKYGGQNDYGKETYLEKSELERVKKDVLDNIKD